MTQQYSEVMQQLHIIKNALNIIESSVGSIENQYEVAAANQVAPLSDRVVALLSGEHKLRSIDALIDATNASRDEIINALEDANVAVVFKRRTRDGAELIGLVARNR